MDSVISHVLAWPTLGFALLVFGFALGVALRFIVLAFRRDDPRRKELIAELYAVPRLERPFWVAQQVEVALFEGFLDRLVGWRARRAPRLQGTLFFLPEEHCLILGANGLLYAGRHQEGGIVTDQTVPRSRVNELARYVLSRYDLDSDIRSAVRNALRTGAISELHPR